MATLKNNQDGILITQEPTFITEWEANPRQEIKFNMPVSLPLPETGDRIHVRTDIATRGKNAGLPVEIYYILRDGITTMHKGTHREVTAVATRTEV